VFGSWPQGVRAVQSSTGDGAWRACFALPAAARGLVAGSVWPSGDPGSGIREVADGAGNRFLVRQATW
jgi:hypothetical protein